MSDAANQLSLPQRVQRHAGSAERRIGADEQLITLTEATKLLPEVDGRKPAVCTLWRWCRKGLRGMFLEYVRVGRKICTTREALLRFFTDLAELDEKASPSAPPLSTRTPVTSRQRQRALAEADRILEEAGI